MYPSSSSARWSLPNPEYYTLRYADGPQLYITEQVSVRGSSLLMSWVRVQNVLDQSHGTIVALILEEQHLCSQRDSDSNGAVQPRSFALLPLHACRCGTLSRVVWHRSLFTCAYRCALQIRLGSFPPHTFSQFKFVFSFRLAVTSRMELSYSWQSPR